MCGYISLLHILFHLLFLCLHFEYGLLLLFFKDLLIIHFREEKERECASRRKGQRERGGRLPANCGAWRWAGFQDPEVMSWAKTKSPTANWLSHPDTLNLVFILCTIFVKIFIRRQNSQADSSFHHFRVRGKGQIRYLSLYFHR